MDTEDKEKKITPETKRVIIPCDCRCCALMVEKNIWPDGDIDYDISVVDSRYDHDVNSVFGRIKRAAGVLVSKPVPFNDAYVPGDEEFSSIIDQLTELLEWSGEK